MTSIPVVPLPVASLPVTSLPVTSLHVTSLPVTSLPVTADGHCGSGAGEGPRPHSCGRVPHSHHI